MSCEIRALWSVDMRAALLLPCCCCLLALSHTLARVQPDLARVPPTLYSNHFVAKVRGGRGEARQVADKLGLRLLPTELLEDHYHYVEARAPAVSLRAAWRNSRALAGHRSVSWSEQQQLKQRVLRSIWFVDVTSNDLKPVTYEEVNYKVNDPDQLPKFDDPFYPAQWYLHGRGRWSDGTNPRHLNVESAWARGLSGRGVTLYILDDGLQASNREIKPNYEAWGGVDLSDIFRPRPNPAPRSSDDKHGTYCAAIVAAAGNNQFCGVGIAYEAKVGGVRLLGSGPLTDLQESVALSEWLNIGDIASASWGPKDDGLTVDGPGPLARAAFRKGVSQGREGLGVIYVWAVGNGGIRGDNCNLDGYSSSIYTVTIAALDYMGRSCEYSEPCAAILASAFVGGPRVPNLSSVVVPELDGSCKKNFQGTSAAAPLAAGIIALLLEANPSLTWRDVQHLVVITSRKLGDEGWLKNGAGFLFHPKQGFGALDAGALVAVGRNFTSLPPQVTVTFSMIQDPRMVPALANTSVTLTLPRSSLPMNKLEHVEVTVTLQHARRSNLLMFIISPAGTESQVLTERPLDKSAAGFSSWHFMSVNFWGEDPAGSWTFVVCNLSELPGLIPALFLSLHGHQRP